MAAESLLPQHVVTGVRGGRLAHAFIFAGADEETKYRAALELAQRLICAADACGECADCRQLLQGSHPDLTVLASEEDSRFIKLEAVKQLMHRATLRPVRGRFKVLIIREASSMNEVSQNALLKTLEEPPAGTVFILIAEDVGALLDTIRSRAQNVYFASRAGTRQSSEELEPYIRETLDYLSYHDFTRRAVPDLSKLERTDLLTVLEEAMAYLRDLALMQVGAKELVAERDRYERERAASGYTPEQIQALMDAFVRAKTLALQNSNQRLLLANLWDSLEEAYA